MATAQCETSTSNAITLRGSTELVTEFFGYAVNNILFQRGVYPPEEFERKQKYGLGVMVTTETKLREYLVGALEQVNDWLMGKDLKKLVLVLADARTALCADLTLRCRSLSSSLFLFFGFGYEAGSWVVIVHLI